ncbi:ATP-dependent DNA helicase Q4 [Bienertia sinuspersici]
MLLNNCCESFNHVLREAREKPIIQLMEWIRRWVMQRCCAKREALKNYDGVIMPSVVKVIHRGLEEVYSMRVNQADLLEFEVDHDDDTYVVNLETREYSYYRWSLMGIPCWHALACIQKLDLNYEDYIHPTYHIQTYAATYAPPFKAMPGQKQWEVTPYPKPKPPTHRVMLGRPSKKKRRKEQGEDQERQHVKRAKKQNKCSRCGGLGHYKTKCNNPVPEKTTTTQLHQHQPPNISTVQQQRANRSKLQVQQQRIKPQTQAKRVGRRKVVVQLMKHHKTRLGEVQAELLRSHK